MDGFTPQRTPTKKAENMTPHFDAAVAAATARVNLTKSRKMVDAIKKVISGLPPQGVKMADKNAAAVDKVVRQLKHYKLEAELEAALNALQIPQFFDLGFTFKPADLIARKISD